jgi:hypothetical protein
MKKLLTILSCSLALTTAHATSTLFSPYVAVSLIDANTLANASRENKIKSLRLAFVVDGGVCEPIWYDRPDGTIESKWALDYITQLNNYDIKYIISFGGADGRVLSENCSETELIAKLEKIITTYHPKGLDFDIEVKTKSVTTLLAALQTTQKNHPDLQIIFTLPVKPNGLNDAMKAIVQQAKTNHIKFVVNIMTMDYGKDFTGDMAQYAISAANSLFNYLKSLYPQSSDETVWRMIELTPMIGINDVQGEMFTLDNAETLRNFANEKQIHALSMWSVGRDQPCTDKVASPVCSGADQQAVPYEFTRAFLGI